MYYTYFFSLPNQVCTIILSKFELHMHGTYIYAEGGRTKSWVWFNFVYIGLGGSGSCTILLSIKSYDQESFPQNFSHQNETLLSNIIPRKSKKSGGGEKKNNNNKRRGEERNRLLSSLLNPPWSFAFSVCPLHLWKVLFLVWNRRLWTAWLLNSFLARFRTFKPDSDQTMAQLTSEARFWLIKVNGCSKAILPNHFSEQV